MTVVVGTAGHIDHGKTTLLHALTGIDADRLPEERRRGMTIDVGYAHLALPDGDELDFVDVPGHDRLVPNMLVGAGEIDAALLVVAADDGPRAQTLEHLELLDALGIGHGIAVVAKADVVEPARAAHVAESVRGLLARTTLAAAPVVVASARTGAGLEDVRLALAALRDRVLSRGLPGGGSRLAVDRGFSVRGRGLVVTGTLRGEPLAAGTSLRVVPGDGSVRVREVQVHGRTVRTAGPGRTAVNLAGLGGQTISRGTVLTSDRAVVASDRILIALRRTSGLAGGDAPLPRDRSRVQLHVGTARVGATVGRPARESVELPNGETTALLRLDQQVAVGPGDRFVLRRSSPAGTLAGGRVLDAEPPRGVSRRRASANRLAALAAARTGEELAAARLDLHGAVATVAGADLAADVRAALDERILSAVSENGAIGAAELAQLAAPHLRRLVALPPDISAVRVSAAAVDDLVAGGRLARTGGRVHDPSRPVETGPSPAVLGAMARLEAELDVAAPPPLVEAARRAGCPPDGIRALEASGRIVRLEPDLAYAAAAFAALEERALELATERPLTPAALRDATGTSRKYVMSILEELDRRGVLRRTPDGHVPGPRARVAARR